MTYKTQNTLITLVVLLSAFMSWFSTEDDLMILLINFFAIGTALILHIHRTMIAKES